MNLMDVIDFVVYGAAQKADPEQTATVVTSAQKIWDAGESFISDPKELIVNMMPKQREADSQEEVEAAAQSVNSKLADIALRGMMQEMSRDTAKALIGVLEGSPLATINLFGVRLTAYDMRLAWNDQHQDDYI